MRGPSITRGVISIFTCLIGIHALIFVQWHYGCGYLFYERLLGAHSTMCLLTAWGFAAWIPLNAVIWSKLHGLLKVRQEVA